MYQKFQQDIRISNTNLKVNNILKDRCYTFTHISIIYFYRNHNKIIDMHIICIGTLRIYANWSGTSMNPVKRAESGVINTMSINQYSGSLIVMKKLPSEIF